MDKENELTSSGFSWRVAVSIGVVLGWMIFLLLYAAFRSSGFTLFQNIVIVLVSFIGGIAVLPVVWASYRLRKEASHTFARSEGKRRVIGGPANGPL